MRIIIYGHGLIGSRLEDERGVCTPSPPRSMINVLKDKKKGPTKQNSHFSVIGRKGRIRNVRIFFGFIRGPFLLL